MARRNGSSPVSSSSREYETNWSSLAIAALVVLAAGGVLALPWFAFQAPEASRESIDVATQALAQPSSADIEGEAGRATVKPLAVRSLAAADDEEAPVFDVRRHYAWYGSSVRTIVDGFGASASTAATSIETRASVAWSPLDVVLRSDAFAALYDRPVARHQRRQWQSQTEDELREYLMREVPELALDQVQGTSQVLFKASSPKQSDVASGDQHLALLQKMSQERLDMAGLPLQLGDACKTNEEVAKQRQVVARTLRELTDERTISQLMQRRAQAEAKDAPVEEYLLALIKDKIPWKHPHQVTMLEQLLQSGEVSHRRLLILMLEQIEGREASEALARRAVFDLDLSVRASSHTALASRDRADYAHILERGDRFPLAATKHASAAARQAYSAACVAGGPQPNLMTMPATLDDFACVSRPYSQPCGTYVVDELVKVNHLRNCTLCHPASTSRNDPLRGPIPQPGQELPRVYYSESRGDFVRADVVYIRQDFSVMLPVENAHPWPKLQRYDFFFRTRPASGVELAEKMARRSRAQAWINWMALVVREEMSRWQSLLTTTDF